MAPKQLQLLPEAEQEPACSCEVTAQGWGLPSLGNPISGEAAKARLGQLTTVLR